MNLRYRQSEPHPDSDAAHLGSSPHSCVGIMRRRIPHEHIAEGSAVGDGTPPVKSENLRREKLGLHICKPKGRTPFG